MRLMQEKRKGDLEYSQYCYNVEATKGKVKNLAYVCVHENNMH